MSVRSHKGLFIKPGECRCCGAVKECRLLDAEYEWLGQREIYSNMFFDCFVIMLSQLGGEDLGRLICDACVERLRDAHQFKHQVLQCEERLRNISMEIDAIHNDKEVVPVKIEPEMKKEEIDIVEEPLSANMHNDVHMRGALESPGLKQEATENSDAFLYFSVPVPDIIEIKDEDAENSSPQTEGATDDRSNNIQHSAARHHHYTTANSPITIDLPAKSPVTIDLPAKSPVTIDLPEDSTSLEICELRLLLNGTLEGKGLLNLDKTVPLNNAARLCLVRIIGTSILRQNPEQIVRSSVYEYWARAITNVFPQEKASVYFHTKFVESTRGIITRLAGKLPDQIHNLKRKYRDSGVVEKRRRISRPSDSSRCSSLRLPDGITDEVDAEEKLLWLRNSSEPWTTVEQKWGETIQSRLIASKEITMAQYFNEYPALKKPKGYLLLQKDFEYLYKGKYTDIAQTFPALKGKIFELAKMRKSSTKDKSLDLLLTYERGSEETSNIACLQLIPSLLAITSVRLKNMAKKIWRPSKAEVTAGFILHVKNNSDIHNEVISKQKKFQEYGLTMQPFIIIVGESLKSIKTYYVVINEVFYAVSNILSAVSLCFKITWVVNARYPIECHGTWMFIQNGFFKFKTRFDSSSTSALTLLAELGIDS